MTKLELVLQVVQAVQHRQETLARHAERGAHAVPGQRVGEDPSAVPGFQVGFHVPQALAQGLRAIGERGVGGVEHAAHGDEAMHHVRNTRWYSVATPSFFSRSGIGAALVKQGIVSRGHAPSGRQPGEALCEQRRSAPVEPVRLLRQVVAAEILHALLRQQVALAVGSIDGCAIAGRCRGR